MLRRSLLALSLLASALPVSSANAESSTTRIEPRPYYGAVVTVEQGVRVWRPLPPTRHMIINPTGSPVSVNISDVRETINHNGLPMGNYGASPYAVDGYNGGNYGYPGYHYGRPFRHFGHRAGVLRHRAIGGGRRH